MKIKATFLDEISHDIPHQNWGEKEWDQDFAYMKQVGINTVVLIRSGYKKWLTYPSKVLMEKENAYHPSVDLVNLFLELSEKHQMDFYFGLYDSGRYWVNGDFQNELDLNKLLIDEVWSKYGKRSAFKGWYISQECSRKTGAIIEMYRGLGEYCKSVSGNLTTLISPYIDGIKNISQYQKETSREVGVSLKKHEQDWDEIFTGIKNAIDIVAFQDGHIDFDELDDFLTINKQLADKHGIRSWTNSETFDRDMPIKFLPIKWEKLLMKLKAAERVGMEQAITFEFSHFMSPQSAYLQAGHLYNRYLEYLATLEG
ncbi:MAG: DUF4434 domain-containing protein [Draconibacterium sp.]